MKKFLSILCFSCLLSGSLASCTNGDNIEDSTISNELPAPKGALQEIFYKLSNNNFSLSYTDRYAALGVTRTQETRYTSYSLESNGDLGFNGYAQNDECVFSYNIVDNEIVSGVPVIDYNNGILITDIYNYRDGLQNFDYTFLPSDYKSGEEYIYEFGKNELNDELLVSVFLRKTYNPAAKPKEIKMKVVAGNLMVDCINTYYEIQDDYDTCQVVTFDIGTTENSLIKKYLDDGKTSKTPLDSKFYQLIAPYLQSYNYKTTLDARELKTEDGMGYETFVQDQYFTENAILFDTTSDDVSTVSGVIQTIAGTVSEFEMDSMSSKKLNIVSTPQNQDGEYYTYLYDEYLTYSMASLNFSNFIGYIDEEHKNSYYITDSQTCSILSYICLYETNDTDRALRSLRLEVNDWDTNEFTLYFDIYNRSTNLDKGVFKATFSSVDNLDFDAVDRYLNIGEMAYTQDKSTLESVLNKFKNHNYSTDLYTSAGLAKAYYTKDYYYLEPYGNPLNNEGFIKIDDAVYEFKLTYDSENNVSGINIDKSLDYAAAYGMKLPGCGTYNGNLNDDLYYFSAFSDDLYNFDEYYTDSIFGYSYWRNGTTGLSQKILDYFYPNNTSALPQGSGFMVSDGGKDPYDTRVTLISVYSSADQSQYGAVMSTFYDIENTGLPYLDQYIQNNK